MKPQGVAGGVIRLKRFQSYSPNGKVRETYAAPKGKVFICLILGIEEQPWTGGQEDYRHDEMLNALGWHFGRD